MGSRDHVRRIIAGKATEGCAFWLGNPHPDTWPILRDYFGAATEDDVRRSLRDDYAWICPEFFPGVYRHPEGRGVFDFGVAKTSHGQAGPLADCEHPDDLARFEWPNPDYLDFAPCLEALRNAGDIYRASGMWTPFYHVIMDLFGMEHYMTKMCTHPDVVLAATDRVCTFYQEANERFFREAGDLVDGYFFGNDFGTQRDLMIGLEQFDRFVLPWFQRFTDQAHRHGLQVILHSCGSIHRVIGRLIDAGVECLHPLQAQARDMDADTLARDFRGHVAFLGGIDTQKLLVHGTPQAVKEEVRRVRALLEPCYIVSPSHEALLPNVPPENVWAMAEAARN